MDKGGWGYVSNRFLGLYIRGSCIVNFDPRIFLSMSLGGDTQTNGDGVYESRYTPPPPPSFSLVSCWIHVTIVILITRVLVKVFRIGG
jgi:hypothetical protein